MLSVGYFAAHAEDNAKEPYLRFLPSSDEANEGRVRYHWRFDTPESYQAYMTRYYRLIIEVDDAIGRLWTSSRRISPAASTRHSAD